MRRSTQVAVILALLAPGCGSPPDEPSASTGTAPRTNAAVQITELTAKDVTPCGATLSWRVEAADGPVSSRVESVPSVGSTRVVQGPGLHAIRLQGLAPETTYVGRVVVEAGNGDETGASWTFRTPAQAGVAALELRDDFERGLESWERKADVPTDAEGRPAAWSIRSSDAMSRGTGRWSAQFDLEGRLDDGTAWLERRVEVPCGRSYDVHFSVHGWALGVAQANHLADLVMYAGLEPPTNESSFPPSGSVVNREGSDSAGLRRAFDEGTGWNEYEFTWRTRPLSDNFLHVAVGVSVVWETNVTRYADDIEVNFLPV